MTTHFKSALAEELSAHNFLVLRAMFGGYGVYYKGLIVGITVGEDLYLKVDNTNRAKFEAIGSHPFTYAKANQKSATLSYWLLPANIIEREQELLGWIVDSYQVSQRAKQKK